MPPIVQTAGINPIHFGLGLTQYGRYGGYRRNKSLLEEAGWKVGCDRVQRIWRRQEQGRRDRSLI